LAKAMRPGISISQLSININSVKKREMMKVKTPLPFDCKVHIDQVVGPRGQADEPGNEKHKPLYASQVWVAVGYYSGDYQT
jgi:hypothetical protein